MATDAEAIKAGFTLPTGTDLIKNGDNAITQNAKATVDGLAALNPTRPPIPMDADLNDYHGLPYVGNHASWTTNYTASIKNLPPELAEDPKGFIMDVKVIGKGTIQQIDSYFWPPKRWIRNSAPSTNAGWTAWRKVLMEGDVVAPETQTPQAKSGYKTLPFPLTAGRGGNEGLAPTSAAVEYDVNLAPNIEVGRYRFAIRDGNPRWGTSTAARITLSGITVGGVSKLTAMTTRDDGSITYSPWMTGNFGNLKFNYATSQAPRLIVGGGKINNVRKDEMPFELWYEVEVPVNTPAIAVIGDSNSVGVNATIPLNDSWISQYARKMGIFPIMWGHSGDGMSASGTTSHYKWNRWNHLDRADLVIHAMGANDLPEDDSRTTAQMQEFFRTEWAIADEKISTVHHGAILKSSASGKSNTARVGYNHWIKSLADGMLRDWHDISSPVTTGDSGGLLPQFKSNDNIHMNTAGQAAIANGISTTITAPLQRYAIDQTAGRTVKIWDYINNREQLIYGDTGLRDITALSKATSGKLRVSRQGNMVWLYLEDVMIATIPEGNTAVQNLMEAGVLPSGFRPIGSSVWQGVHADHSSSGVRRQLAVATSGWMPLYYSAKPTDIYRTIMTWPTADPWPTTLPGTAV